MAADLTSFLVAQLTARGIRVDNVEGSGENIMAWCFNGHDEKAASLSIHRASGMFYCYGCGVKGKDWNALAALIGGDKLRDQDLPDPFSIISDQLSRHIAKAAVKAAVPWGLKPWDRGKYRGLSEGFLKRVEAHLWYDDGVRTDRIFFPIYQRTKLMGWVARRLDSDSHMKYRNSPKLPATKILYPFDFVHKQFNCSTIVLVEGPMDALRLCYYHIPALAIMGTNNWRDKNRGLLTQLGAKRVIICMDADAAGKKCRYEVLEPSLETWFKKTEHFHPPHGEDPGCMSREQINELKKLVET